MKSSPLKEVFIAGLIGLSLANTASYGQTSIKIGKRNAPAVAVKQPLVSRPFSLSDFKTPGGKTLSKTDVVKTISGKPITADDYLGRINKFEAEINKKGNSLRKFSPSAANFIYKPVVLDQTKLLGINTTINKGLAPLPPKTITGKHNTVFQIQKATPASFLPITMPPPNPAVVAELLRRFGTQRPAETIEQNFSVEKLLKPLADKINAEIGAGTFKFAMANMVVRSHAEPSRFLSLNNSPYSILTANSEFKVSVNFGGQAAVPFGPISIEVPLATMNGEFTAPSDKNKKLSRKVVVNLLGKSLFNKTTTVNANTLDEEDNEELDLHELTRIPSSPQDFVDFIPSIGFKIDVSTAGSVGCMYKVHMTRSSVDAYIGPTYAATLRVSASFNVLDVAEGGIEGIFTLLEGGLGFGGVAGLGYDGTKYRLNNEAHVVGTLKALKGEVDFFVRYPDLANWSCGIVVPLPCIKKDKFPIFESPTAFTLTGTLLAEDKGKTLTW